MSTPPNFRPLIDFIIDRAPFMTVVVTPQFNGGDGWDIAIRIDGTYYGNLLAEPEEMRDYFAELLVEALDAAGIDHEMLVTP